MNLPLGYARPKHRHLECTVSLYANETSFLRPKTTLESLKLIELYKAERLTI